MKTKRLSMIAACLALMIQQAKADTFIVFNVSGTAIYNQGSFNTSNLPLSGTITVDVDLGIVSAASLSIFFIGGPWNRLYPPEALASYGLDASHLLIGADRYNAGTSNDGTTFGCDGHSAGGCHDTLRLNLSNTPLALVALQGGLIIGGGAGLYDANSGDRISLITGTLTPVSSVPLPATLPLFVTGLGILAFMLRRRHE